MGRMHAQNHAQLPALPASSASAWRHCTVTVVGGVGGVADDTSVCVCGIPSVRQVCVCHVERGPYSHLHSCWAGASRCACVLAQLSRLGVQLRLERMSAVTVVRGLVTIQADRHVRAAQQLLTVLETVLHATPPVSFVILRHAETMPHLPLRHQKLHHRLRHHCRPRLHCCRCFG